MLDKPCAALGRKLDKKVDHRKLGPFAHPILWIFMGLSTTSVQTKRFSSRGGARL
jgi:hypothetical protein